MSSASSVVGPIREVLSPYKIAIVLFIVKYSRVVLRYGDLIIINNQENDNYDVTPSERKATAHLLFKFIQSGDLSFSQVTSLIDSSSLSCLHVAAWHRALKQVVCQGVEGLQSLFDACSRVVMQDTHNSWPCFATSIVGLYLRQMTLLYKRLSFIEMVTMHSHFVKYCKQGHFDCSPSLLEQTPADGGLDHFTLPSALDITMSSPPRSPSPIPETPSAGAGVVGSDGRLQPTALTPGHVSSERATDTALSPQPSNDLSSESSHTPLFESSRTTPLQHFHTSSQPSQAPPPQPSQDPTSQPSHVPPPQSFNAPTPQPSRAPLQPSHSLAEDLHGTAWSVQQAEQLIGAQTQLLEFNESAALPPRQLHDTLQRVLAVHPHLSAAHYLSCLNYLRVREARGAVESLAAAYDCQQVTRATPRTLRYAALNMAALYSHFGSKSVALRCVSEAIAQSQEAGDNTCLQHALAWLYALAPHHKREALIQSAVQRSAALQLPYLSWLSLINQAAHTSGRPPSHHLQMLVSRVDGCVGVGGVGAGSGGVWGVEAGVWSGWLGGCSSMAAVCSQLVLHAPPQLPQQPSVPYATSETAAALCNLAVTLADTGSFSLCQSVLGYASSLFPSSSPHSHYVRLTRAHVQCTQHVLLGQYSRALHVLRPVAAEHDIYVKMRRCEVAANQGEAECVLQLVSELRASKDVQAQPHLLVQVELLYGTALCIAGHCSAALPTLVSCVSLAKSNHLALLHSQAHLQLLAVQLQLGLLPSAPCRHTRPGNPSLHTNNYYELSPSVHKEALDRALAVVMSSGSVYDQARALLLLAKLRVLAASKQPEKLCRVARDLERVKCMFAQVEAHHRVRDVLYLSARVWHAAGVPEARNRCSMEFKKLERALPCSGVLPPTPVF